MEIKKNPQADLERHRTTYTQIGLAVVLGLMLVAFNWTTTEKKVDSLGVVVAINLEEEMIATEREQLPEPPPPPPPPQELVIEQLTIVEDNQQETNIDFSTEATEDTRVTQRDIIQVKEEEVVEEPEIFLVVEEQPEFPGGMAKLMEYLRNNIKYPQIAKENGIQGKVFVSFVVDPNGKVTRIKVVRGVDPALDAEAIRVVENMPPWKPGKQRGKPVYVQYNLPINFQLQ